MTTPLLAPEEAADRISVCTKTLRRLRAQGLIRYVAVTERKIMYRPEDCDAFLESRVRMEPPSEPTRRRSARRLRSEGNVVSFLAGRRERMAARGR